MRTLVTALLLGAALTSCGTGAGIAATAAAGGSASALEVQVVAADEAPAPALDTEVVGPSAPAPDPPSSIDPGLVGHAAAMAAMTPLALDGNVQTTVWGLYFDFRAKYGSVIDEMRSTLGTVDGNDSTESIIAGACATKAAGGAVTDEYAAALAEHVGPILDRQQIELPTLLGDIAVYHREVIALGVCA